jgi:hypothetical protein
MGATVSPCPALALSGKLQRDPVTLASAVQGASVPGRATLVVSAMSHLYRDTQGA